MKRELIYIIAIILLFSLYFVTNESLFAEIYYPIEGIIHFYPLSYALTYLIVGLPLFIFIFVYSKFHLLDTLGLDKGFVRGITWAFLFSVPMFVGYGLISNFNIQIDSKTFWIGCVIAAFFEELYYRGIFFGQLYRNTRLGFFPALILSALVFASLHLYQSNDMATLVGIFITTFLGAGLFAWLYVEWNYNLWIGIGLHFFMNLSWSLFSISDNALGDLGANLIRGATIVLAIVGTIIYKKRKDLPLSVNRYNLLIKSQNKSKSV